MGYIGVHWGALGTEMTGRDKMTQKKSNLRISKKSSNFAGFSMWEYCAKMVWADSCKTPKQPITP